MLQSPTLLLGVLAGLAFMLQAPSDWLTDAVRPVLVAQAVVGTIALIGLVAVLRRFLSTEFPAAMHAVNSRLDRLHEDFKSLETEFRRSLLEVERLKEKVENLARRTDSLDDTAMRRRRNPPS